MKQIFSKLIYGGSFFLSTLLAQESNLQDIQTLNNNATPQKKTLRERLIEKELELQVPRETVPITESKYPIKTNIPKTAYYLPFLQTLLHIEPGTLPNPIGISLIGSYTTETYRVKKFKGQMGANLGNKISSGLNPKLTDLQNSLSQISSIKNIINDGGLFGYTNALGLLTPGLIWNGKKGQDGVTNRADFFDNLATTLNNAFGTGEKEWELSDGTIRAMTGAVGAKFDIYLFPFMNLFVTAAYIRMEQETNVGSATIPLDQPIVLNQILTGAVSSALVDKNGNPTQINSVTFNVGSIKNILNGYVVMGGN